MPFIPDTVETTTKTVTSYKVIEFRNSIAREMITITYVKAFDDDTYSPPLLKEISGAESIRELYALMDAEIATGKTFEEASKQVLYGKLDKDGIIS